MMKKNAWKVVSSLVVIVVCVLLFLQCPDDKSKRKSSGDNVLSAVVVKKEMAVETKKQSVSDTLDTAKSDKNVSESTKQIQLNKTPVYNTAKKVKLERKTVRQQVQKADKSLLQDQKDSVVSIQKEEDVLLKELTILSEKVDVLWEKVRVLLERVNAVLGKVKADAPNEEVSLKKAENKSSEDKSNEVLLVEEVVFQYPTHVLAGGVSTYKEWTGYGLQGSYAYRINNYFSLGLQGNAFFKEGKYRGDRSLYAGVRANFHIFPLLVKNSNFDLYVGGTAGIGRDDAVETFEAMGYMGISYDLCRHWGVFAEAGNIGVLGLRLKF